MTTDERLNRLEEAVRQLTFAVCEGQDPRTMPEDRNSIKRQAKAWLGDFITATEGEGAASDGLGT